MRIFAVSDLHADCAENMAWIRALGFEESPSSYSHDVLIVAGDLAEHMKVLETALSHLVSVFGHVFYTPGNHELYLHAEDFAKGYNNSFVKREAILALCARLGVHTSPAIVDRVRISPIHAWHHASWDKEPDVSANVINNVNGSGSCGEGVYDEQGWRAASDYHRCVFPGHAPGDISLARVFDKFNDHDKSNPTIAPAKYVSKSSTAAFSPPTQVSAATGATSEIATEFEFTISFSHFLPRQDLMPLKRSLLYPWLPRICGSTLLGTRVNQLRPNMHIFGHTHISWDAVCGDDGIRYVQNALGTPRDRERGIIEPAWQMKLLKVYHDGDWTPPKVSTWCTRYATKSRDPSNTQPEPHVIEFWRR